MGSVSRLLSVGAGSGYNAALLAEIVGRRGRVITLEIDEDLVAGARAHLAAAGYRRVEVVQGDGADGIAAHAPYDRIIVTVGTWDIAPAWFEQLGPAGRLMLPLWMMSMDWAIAFDRADGHLVSRSWYPCIFKPMGGGMASPPTTLRLREHPRIVLCVDDATRFDASALHQALTGPWRDHSTGVSLILSRKWSALYRFVMTREPDAGRLAQLVADAEAMRSHHLPDVVGRFDREADPGANTFGMVTSDSLAMMTLPQGGALHAVPDPSAPVEVHVRAYGPGGDDLARRMMGHVQQWERAGQPDAGQLHIRAYPIDASCQLQPGESQLLKRFTRLVFNQGSVPNFPAAPTREYDEPKSKQDAMHQRGGRATPRE